MSRLFATLFVLSTLAAPAFPGQVPGPAATPDIPVNARDRVYAAEQFSNTISVINPAENRLLGVIRLGDPQPANLSPLYRGQLLVHGLGFSSDHRTLVVVSVQTDDFRRPPHAGWVNGERWIVPRAAVCSRRGRWRAGRAAPWVNRPQMRLTTGDSVL